MKRLGRRSGVSLTKREQGRMGKGKHEVASHERRVKRVALRHGLHLMKAQKPFGKVAEHGGYMLRSEETRRVVFGNAGYEFSADLDEIEAHLESLGAAED